ncbi:beta-N-acetylhexosaminidase [Haliscomenobacter hydrossis]|uniref:beta-N-acetylhexosaminidase n=1 Tax=Haliscomenobacter hydrossis (strain ATCC 27775 / DSM 1100 / LMG 10767 / O) TaxID=760192 RepID=F4L0D3_HALH1|nr:beta-N-acetylhexosaminidase [Haliscomenobacter hydrossis]AEE53806.1 Beta-N-acetylhexosaminidase [Haliscomenobacter hydrossis DSM 1100]
MPTNRITYYSATLLCAALLTFMGCAPKKAPPISMDLAQESIIPIPVSIKATNSSFELTDASEIYVQTGSEELLKIGQFLADKLNPSTGFDFTVKASTAIPDDGNIYLSLKKDAALGDEGYTLSITPELVHLEANAPAGLFRGVQTIRQLLPAKIEMSSKQEGPWRMASGTINDVPVYAFRGAMFDVARHFFSVEDTKRYIDLIAAYKMNVMHLHLSDDQGWRIEIKSWPKLAEHGGKTQVGGGKGGYYTQEQYKDIVQYALDRYITIIPEIDMPGHTNAALAAYPELNCDGKARELYTGTEVGFSTLCTQNEITYKFIDDVMRELAAMTPGPYIHIGGDESHVTKKEDYIPFVNRVQNIVLKHGKQVIGWDEIALGTLKKGAFVQHWADVDNAVNAVKQGSKVLMSPARKAYMDMQYDSTTKWGLHWAAYIEVDSAYIWDPATLAPGVTQKDVLGIEAPLWSETVDQIDEVEYMVFPRLPGYAEIGWSAASARNWGEYKKRLGAHGPRFTAMGINYYPSKLVEWKEEKNQKN